MKGLLTTTKKLKQLIWQALMSGSTSSRRTGEVDAAVAVRAQEEGDEGKDERKKTKKKVW